MPTELSENPSPFDEGFHSASFRDGAETVPCPYEDGTKEHQLWWEGFAWYDDIDDLHDDLTEQ